MNNSRLNWLGLIVGVASILVISSAYAADNFVKVRLPKGVSLELPKNWVAISKDQRITLDNIVQSVLDLTAIDHPENSKYVFAANRYENGKTIGIVNVRYYPNIDLAQNEARQATLQDIKEFDAALKENMVKSTKAFGMSILAWRGTKKKSINGITTFITEYSRNERIKDTGAFRVRLVRVFAGDRSFTLTVSFNEEGSFFLKTITDSIIESLRLSDSNNDLVQNTQVVANGQWTNVEDGFGANFPTTPTKVQAATAQGSGYAFQSVQSFDNGGALYAITVSPAPSKIPKNQSKEFLEASNAVFIKMMGQKLSQAKVEWLIFGDGRNKLNYECEFFYDGILFKGLGFWIMDRNRAIRVSVAYTNTLTKQQVREVVPFLDSFMTLSPGG